VLRFGVPPDSPPTGRPASRGERVVAIIPARYHSTRLHGKPLAQIAGRPMIEHVYRRASGAAQVAEVIVATDSERVADAVRAFGGRVEMTSATHRSGSDRVAEVAARIDASIVVNVQGDEPLVAPAAIDQVIAPLLADPSIAIATLARRIEREADYTDSAVVKVVVGVGGRALYFSRSPIPHVRGSAAPVAGAVVRKHIGLYVYRRQALLAFSRLDPTPLERAESLEQLRALEHGMRIMVVDTDYDSIGVDTPEDLERVRQLAAAAREG